MNRMAAPIAAIALMASTAALAAATGPTEAGVRDAENRWSEAFVTGDAAALDALLDADYVSVSASGPAPKARIIAFARQYAAKNPGAHATPMPASSTISVIGDAATVVHHGPAEISVDVFHFDGGRWHAWYSQHTALSPQK